MKSLAWNKISCNYLKGRFWIDFVASIPFDIFSYMFESSKSNQLTLQLIGLLKLVRVLRLSRLITYLNLKNELKMSLKLGKLIFFIILYTHCLAWLWYFIVKQDEKWLPPLDYVWVGTEYYNYPNGEKYLSSIYHAMLMIGGNDVGPRGSLQLWFVSFMLLAGAIINANIFGNMAVILSSLNKKSTTFQEKLDNGNETMKNLKIPSKLMDEIKQYYTLTQITQDHQKELDDFLKTLSPSLRQKVITNIFEDTLNLNSVFRNQKTMITSILQGLEAKIFSPEDKIIKQGEYAISMFFLARGEWSVSVISEKQREIFVRTLVEGDYFGEIGLIKQWKRTASVSSKNYATLAEFDFEVYTKLMSEFPNVKVKMEKHIETYDDPWKAFMIKGLRNIDFLSKNVGVKTIEELMYCLDTININEDTVLFESGTIWKEIFIVWDGKLDLYVNNGNIDKYLDTLYLGSTIGGYSALVGEPYWITAKSKTSWTILKLTIAKLLAVREKFSDLDAKMAEYEKYVEENGLPYWDYRIFRSSHLKLKPIQKFQYGVRRIVSILASYKNYDLRDMMRNLKDTLKKEKMKMETKRRSIMLKMHALTEEQENNYLYVYMKNEFNFMKEAMIQQSEAISLLQKQLKGQTQCDPLGSYKKPSENNSDSSSNNSFDSKDNDKLPPKHPRSEVRFSITDLK